MTSIKDLLDASKNTYSYQSKATEAGVDNYAFFSAGYDEKSNHSGLAYINEKSGEVILAHRGTVVTQVQDLVTDLQIALNWKETKADIAALKFTESVIDDLIDQNFEITKIIQTGHSLGGRLAQHCLKNLDKTSDFPTEAVTFNSARVSTHDIHDQDYKHINLRAKGNRILSTDLVTSYGSHLGKTIDIVLPEVTNFLTAHKLDTFDLMSKYYKNLFEEKSISKIIELSQSNDVDIIKHYQMNSKDNLDLTKTQQAQIGQEYSGEIIAETQTDYIQKLDQDSNQFINHPKTSITHSLNIGDKVKIQYPFDPSSKASIQNINNIQTPSMTR